MNEVPHAAVSDLILLGGCGDGDANLRQILLARLRPFERVNWLGWNEWSRILELCDETSSRHLVQGLALGELLLKWSGGSAASVIWAFQVFQRRFPRSSENLADWILQRSENPYALFGSMRAGVRFFPVNRSYVARNAERRNESLLDQARQKIHKQVRLTVRHRLAAERLHLQAAHSRARHALVEELKGLPVKNRLEHIAWDDFHCLAYYPSAVTNVTREEFSELDGETRQKLLDKLAARHKGAWLRTFRRLRYNAR